MRLSNKKIRSSKKLERIRISLSVSRQLLKASWRLLWEQKRLILGVAAVNIAVNLALILLAGPSLQSAYQSLWFAFASCAMIWAIRHVNTKNPPTIRQAYWSGTSPTLKFMIVLAVLVAVGIPLTVGAFIFGTLSWLVSTNAILKATSALIWAGFSVVSLLLLARLILSLPIATLPEVGPFQAVGMSWRMSAGLGYKIAWRLLVLFICTILVVGLVNLALAVLPFAKSGANLVSQLIAWGLVMPFLYTYIFKIYQEVA